MCQRNAYEPNTKLFQRSFDSTQDWHSLYSISNISLRSV